jgi:hypothetical protein
LTQFIEDSFISKVNVIDDYALTSLLANYNQEKTVANIRREDLDMRLYLLTSKNYVEITSKDFAKSYQNSIQVYQNEFGYLDKFQKILAKNNTEHRIFIHFNDLLKNDEKEITLKNVLIPIPINIKQQSPKVLKKMFDLVKYITFQRIYKNNYSKHCINKNLEDAEKTDDELRINLCIVLLEHKKDLDTKNVNYVFFKNMIDNFKKNLELSIKASSKKKSVDEYSINVNFGLTSLDSNKNLKELYEKFLEQKNVKPPGENHKLLFIINDTQEKFSFKWFKEENSLKDYLSEIDKSDFFEDSQFSVIN